MYLHLLTRTNRTIWTLPDVIRMLVLTVLSAILAMTAYSRAASADEPYNPVVSPIIPLEVDAVPPVHRVPGKEYTDSRDVTHAPTPHSARPGQLGIFDGLGGAKDGVLLADFDPDLVNHNVDAQSQIRDRLFDAVRNNRVPLAVSTSFDAMLGGSVSLAAERISGSVEPFATASQIVDHAHLGGQLTDIDSVDLWGIDGQTGTNFFSLQNDPNDTSVYSMLTLAPGGIQPYLTRDDIATALGNPDLAPFIDVDALMAHDVGDGSGTPSTFDGVFGPGDSIMFSLAPIRLADGEVLYDGGEIWVWDHGQPAEFLNHGGHLWGTTFSVGAALGVNTENIDAIEAVSTPEPSALIVLLVCLASAIPLCRRKFDRGSARPLGDVLNG